MPEKLKILLNEYHLTAGTLAQQLNVPAATISHILSGRNKISLEVVKKLAIRFPKVNLSWLMDLSEEMYISSQNSGNSDISQETIQKADEIEKIDIPAEAKNPTSEIPVQQQVRITSKLNCQVSKVIIVYSNGTFESLDPR